MAKTSPIAPTRTMKIDLVPSPEAGHALSIRQRATGLVVVDKDGHREALEFIRGAKTIKRAIEDHWSRITRTVDDMKRSLLDLKRQDLEPVEGAIAIAEAVTLSYQQDEDRRVREEEASRRRDAEARAQSDRDRLLAEQEAAALKLERDSPDLSQRERVFVEAAATYSQGSINALQVRACAVRAGYKDADAAGVRLLAQPKIQKAIQAKRQALELREQAEATKASPLDVAPVQKVEKQTAAVAGTRTVTTYSCEVVDAEKLIQAVLAGHTEAAMLMPNGPKLNDQARQIKDAAIFEKAFPGCVLRKKVGIAG